VDFYCKLDYYVKLIDYQQEGDYFMSEPLECEPRQSLKKHTLQYWEHSRQNAWQSVEEQLNWYVRCLLPFEMKHAEKKGNIQIKSKPCHLLVLMLGHSFEPLIQILRVYKPDKVLVVLNKKYNVMSGEEVDDMPGSQYFKSKFQFIFRTLTDQKMLDKEPEILPVPNNKGNFEEAGESPAEIFNFLRKHVLGELVEDAGKRNNVVIDITGAKKSMVAGAYYFAAFANVSVTYVDFGTFHPGYGKPFGYTCKIQELESPREKFGLMQWIHVKTLVQQHGFLAAHDLVDDTLLPLMEQPIDGGHASDDNTMDEKKNTEPWFVPGEIKAAEKLRDALKVCQHWEEGNYTIALQEWNRRKQPCRLPAAIERLGQNSFWPSHSQINPLLNEVKKLQIGSPGNFDLSLYLDHEKLMIYAEDEIKKIKLLIEKKEDYRSGLLRAAGLSELLIKARFVLAWYRGDLVIKNVGDVNRSDIRQPQQLDEGVATSMGIPSLVKTLLGNTENIRIGRDWFRFLLSPSIRRMRQFWTQPEMTPEELAKLRNSAIHFTIPVSEQLASQSLNLVEKNLNEFDTNWKTQSAPDYVELTWEKLCKDCGVEFLPPL